MQVLPMQSKRFLEAQNQVYYFDAHYCKPLKICDQERQEKKTISVHADLFRLLPQDVGERVSVT